MRTVKSGITLMEILVVIGVIAILLSITIPAIQSAREASRRVSCINNLRNLGIAIHNYESSYRVLPPLSGPFNHSMFVSLLPFLEQQSLFDRYRFDWDGPGAEESNNKFRESAPPGFMCPSNGSLVPRSDYLVNQGNRYLFPSNGPFAVMSMMRDRNQTRFIDITTGTSNVIAMSETRLHGVGPSFQQTDMLTERDIVDEDSANRFVSDCTDRSVLRSSQNSYAIHGFWWDLGEQTRYQHILTPNRWDCSNGSRPPNGIYTVNSLHSSGVNGLYLDGRVDFVANAIEAVAWIRIGQR